MDISVIICTYNRPESLKNTLRSLGEIIVPRNLSWEIVVIDNNSDDHTKEVVENFIKNSGLNVRYIFERKQGISHARNRAILEAKGNIVAFTDDDVIVKKDWLDNIEKAFKDHDISGIGGKILPVWGEKKPPWLKEDFYGYFALLDHGEKPFYLESANIWGANFAIKSDMLKKYGGFDTNRGRVPGKLYAGEETSFLKKLLDAKEKLLYWPDAVVYHCIPKKRLSRNYLRRWKFDNGELDALLLGKYTNRNFLGIPYYIIKGLLKSLLCYFSWSICLSSNKFAFELNIIYLLGFVIGRLKYKHPN